MRLYPLPDGFLTHCMYFLLLRYDEAFLVVLVQRLPLVASSSISLYSMSKLFVISYIYPVISINVIVVTVRLRY